MKKKIIALCLVLALAVTAIAGATLAYFTDTDSAENVMALGNVNIEQLENGEVEDGFDNGQPLFPMVDNRQDGDELFVGGYFNPAMLNVIDKEITVKNMAKEDAENQDAYVRTIILFETNAEYKEGTDEVLRDEATIFDTYIGCLGKGITYTKEVVEIDDVKYIIAYKVYKDALVAGAESEPSLKQVFLSPDAGNEVATLFGEEYTILALSQAVQTGGFATAEEALNEAFGEINAANVATWF